MSTKNMMLILVLMALLLFQVAFITNVAIVLASPSGGWIQTYGTETNKDRANPLSNAPMAVTSSQATQTFRLLLHETNFGS
jgi:hypothetical protein